MSIDIQNKCELFTEVCSDNDDDDYDDDDIMIIMTTTMIMEIIIRKEMYINILTSQ